ncbi:MAG: peptidyl-prolyl cis-trans isomerase [Solirubrobacteraceae bacterium]
MKSTRSKPALSAFFVAVAAALALAGCGSSGGIPSGDVAVVAGNQISLRAVNHWMYVIVKSQAASSPGTPVIVPTDPPNFASCVSEARAEIPQLKKTPTSQLRTDCKTDFQGLSQQAMQLLITAYWYQADAHKLGINVTPAQVQKALATTKKTQFQSESEYQTFVKQSGMTQADINYRILINQVYTKLAARHQTKVTSATIAAYYSAHKSSFGTAQTRNMRIVLTKTAAEASTAKAALQHGQTWKVVAKKYSTDPTTRNVGGLLSNVKAGQQDQALSTAAFAAPLNKLLGPIKGQFGYYVLDVIKITPATQQTLAQSTAQIRKTLSQQYATDAENVVDAHAKRDWLSKTHCLATYAMNQCSGYKAPKTSSSSTTAAP